ncbi:MAG: FHA domain-containing protein, partial [Deltaproteobacteria bacterium]|nr:FHA domain-containing protein [Deltaproteobacteria bacterium]
MSSTRLVRRADGVEILRVRGFRLTVVAGPDVGRVGTFDRERVTVGTAEAADLRLSDPTVSRAHFEIRDDRDGYVLTDLRSTNGTIVDGVRAR